MTSPFGAGVVEPPQAGSAAATARETTTKPRAPRSGEQFKRAFMRRIKASTLDRYQRSRRKNVGRRRPHRGKTGSLFSCEIDDFGATHQRCVWHDRLLVWPTATVRVIAGTASFKAGHPPAGRSCRQRRDHSARAGGLQRIG